MSDESTGPLVLAHYMPWFSDHKGTDKWRHWSGSSNVFSPDRLQNGKRQIASHYYPLIEPYDSGYRAALDCHVLLMKFAGIDGIIINWCGIDQINDHPILHKNACTMIDSVERAKLRFAICFDFNTVLNADKKRGVKRDYYLHGQEVMKKIQEHFFGGGEYVGTADSPVLLVFGNPDREKPNGDQLKNLLSGFSKADTKALVVTQERPWPEQNARGAFAWPPVEPEECKSGELGWPEFRGYLEGFYNTAERAGERPSRIGLVCPGFHDIYACDGRRDIHKRVLCHGDGSAYEQSLNMALKSGVSFIQIVTWNDWEEGTVIEPSCEYEYRYLETTKRLLEEHGRCVPYSSCDLKLPVKLYQMQRRSGNNGQCRTVSDALFGGDLTRARQLLQSNASSS